MLSKPSQISFVVVSLSMAYRFFNKNLPMPIFIREDNEPTKGTNTWRGWSYYRTMWDAQPPWADREKILEIYKWSQELNEIGDNVEVDHIVPLKHRLVCGLHCEDNLRVIDKRINQQKSNHYWPDSPFEQYTFFGEEIAPKQLTLGI